MLNRELEDAKSQVESKTMECVALVDQRECLAGELENFEEDIRRLRSMVKTQTSRKVIQRRLEAINAQNPFSRQLNLYELLFLPQRATTTKFLQNCHLCCNIQTRVVRRNCSGLFCRRRMLWRT